MALTSILPRSGPFTSILPRSGPAVLPLSIRPIGSQWYHHNHCSALFSAVNRRSLSCRLSRRSGLPVLRSSSKPKRPSPEESLLRFIESEIKSAEETDDHDQDEGVPDDFPFKIQDNPGKQTISLTREYQGETINVEVYMPDLDEDEDEDEDDDDDDDEEDEEREEHGDGDEDDEDEDDIENESNIPLVVRVSKKSGPCLEFHCTAYPDEIAIDTLSIKDPENPEDPIAYGGPDFMDLDENMQEALHKYLEVRGLNTSTTSFLLEYMVNKVGKEYLLWLKNLKKFIQA